MLWVQGDKNNRVIWLVQGMAGNGFGKMYSVYFEVCFCPQLAPECVIVVCNEGPWWLTTVKGCNRDC